MTNEPYIVSAELTPEGQVVVVTRHPSNLMLACSPPRKAPDRIVRTVYGVKGDRIRQVAYQEGFVEPAQTIAERFVWEEPEE